MYQVEGYAFETKEQEHTAKHEVEIIGYIRKNTRMDDPDIVLALYNKLVLKEIFVTPVGYDFLHRLQEYLYTSNSGLAMMIPMALEVSMEEPPPMAMI